MRFWLAPLAGAILWAQTPAPKPVAPVKPAATAPAPAVETAAVPGPNAVVFTVGTEKMTRAQFESFVSNLPENLQKEVSSGNKRRVADQLADLMAMAQEAHRLGLDQKPDVKQQIALQTDSALAQAVVQNLSKTMPVPEAAVAKYYADHKSEYESATARHILIRFQGSRVPIRPGQKDLTEAEALAKAQALRKRIIDGEDFAAVAKAESDDTGSGADGGSLGSFTRGRMVPEFENVVFTQPVGTVSEPIKTQFGYHLIQVQERSVKPLTEVRPEIEQKLRGEMLQQAIKDIHNKSTIVLDEAYFGKPVAPEAGN